MARVDDRRRKMTRSASTWRVIATPDQSDAGTDVLISRLAHIVERAGLAMVGAMCGTFVAAQLTTFSAGLFDSAGFIASMVLAGIAGFYLGIDIPGRRAPQVDPAAGRPRMDPVELLSATGTFLAAIAALISVYAFVFDEAATRAWEFAVTSWWTLGIVMQIVAGLTGRLRLRSKAAG
jgi:hypothetical protein